VKNNLVEIPAELGRTCFSAIKMSIWNKLTGGAFHAPNPQLFSNEIKAMARG
jgi:hypothetical protein